MGINIAVFGAFDINSFGDSLFPRILELELRKRLNLDRVVLFSPTKHQSEYSFGMESYAYCDFESVNREHPFTAIVLGGGELLHNNPIEFQGMDGGRIVYEGGEIWKKPLEYGEKYGIKVLVNSVGMPNNIPQKEKELLARASYISVRDIYSMKRLCGEKACGNVNLVPDMLWVLDEYYPVIAHPDRNEISASVNIADCGRFLAFQFGTMDGWRSAFLAALSFCQRNQYELVVFAVNWCHEDREVIQKIEGEFGHICHVINRMLSHEEIMGIISAADIFVGTTFHGALLGCLSRTHVIAYNMYSYFVSKMDGLAAWLQNQLMLVENAGQLKAALDYILLLGTASQAGFDVSSMKCILRNHYNRMADIIADKDGEEQTVLPIMNSDIQFSRSYFEWYGKSGRMEYKAIISREKNGAFSVNEKIGCDGEAYWYLPTMSFVKIDINSENLKPLNVDELGRCFEKSAKYRVVNCEGNVHFEYRINKIVYEDLQRLLTLYWNMGAHVELLEESERKLKQDNFKLQEENSAYIKQNEELGQKDKELEQQNKLLKQKNNELEKRIISFENNIKMLEQEVKNKEGHIELLLEVEREYEREKHSRTYRMALVFRRISIFFLPVGSKRRFFAKMIAKGLRHPRLMFHMINIRRIRNFFDIVKKEGMDGINYHYQLVEDYEKSKINPFHPEQFEVAEVKEEPNKTLADYQKLVFKECEEPEVSIIIPAYNQFEYTYNCLSSILKNTGEVRYEVILADDCSTDLTVSIDEVAEGITVLHNKENLRFLRNCNHAAESARGKYILFLNNDTQVQPDWLKPLVDILDRDGSVGMVGSKLVYADGHLQEAGGIFWKDASAWNYGNGKNPDDPEFNYVKEADYISGASVMIRSALWKEIGGFDERFAPAYYEDSDLAFEVRKHGYKVVYQPLSVVVHFEGVSNGTDLNSGQKAYQASNQAKFYEKWKDVLEKEHFPNGENVFLAKDRSRFKKQILVVDHYVPHYDKDAGGKCTYMYLLLFVKMGFKVTFIGDNFFKHEPYTTDLNQHGIEVLYGNYYFENWQEWLKENLHYFDYVYLQRPHISIKYIDIVKEYGHAKVLYFAHDLHHVRERREYELTGDEEKLKSSEHWKEIEYELFSKADVGHVVGTYEQGVMQKAFPDKPIRNIPLYIYEDIPTDINKNFRERKDLIYVGGFAHPPNIDAVLWFGKEVFPRILEKYPDMAWHVVGGKVPLEVQEMASDHLIIEGFLPDEELHTLYRSSRIAVVPLRVGAGVKGKVVEAAYYQIPLVTTTIGAEGLSREEGNMAVEDDAEGMAALICELYEDYDRLREMSDAGEAFIRKYFTVEEAERVLLLDIEK